MGFIILTERLPSRFLLTNPSMLNQKNSLRAAARSFCKHAALLIGFAGLSAQAAPIGTYYWGGGSGSIDYTTANWSVTGNAPYNLTLGGASLLAFYEPGAGSTVAFTFDFAGGFIPNGGGYVFQLNGYDLDTSPSDFYAYDNTYDFAGGASSFTVGPSFSFFTMVITGFTVGEDSLRFTSGLSPTVLSRITFSGYGSGGAAQIDGSGYVTPVAAIPEPASFATLAGALALVAVAGRRRRA